MRLVIVSHETTDSIMFHDKRSDFKIRSLLVLIPKY